LSSEPEERKIYAIKLICIPRKQLTPSSFAFTSIWGELFDVRSSGFFSPFHTQPVEEEVILI
jgi:hypothetical protein